MGPGGLQSRKETMTLAMEKDCRRLGRRIRAIYATIDAQLTGLREHKPDISCGGIGCIGCCHQLVLVALPEAILIAERLLTEPRLLEEFGPALAQQADYLETPVSHSRANYFDRAIPCALLRNGACAIYNERPSACRYLFVCSPAANCQPGALDSKVAQVDLRQAQDFIVSESLRISKQARLPLLILPLQQAIGAAIVLLRDGRTAFLRRFGLKEDDSLAWIPEDFDGK